MPGPRIKACYVFKKDIPNLGTFGKKANDINVFLYLENCYLILILIGQHPDYKSDATAAAK
jgi:hypothetical protein